MDEGDVAYRLLADLETTLTGVRGRLADLAALGARGPDRAGARAVLVPEVLPPAEQVCGAAASGPPPALVLPTDVEAPTVVLPADAGVTVEDGALTPS